MLWLATHSVWTVLATALPLLGAAGASSVGRFVGEYDWTVGESPDGLRIDHGLLDRTHETVPPGRVADGAGSWSRCCGGGAGWVRVELDVAGSANSVLVPVAPARDRRVRRRARAARCGRLPPRSALSRPPRRAGWCVPLWWRGYGLAVTDTVFAARHGLLRRSLALVPHAKVQSVRLKQGPWEAVLAACRGACGHRGQQDRDSAPAGRGGGGRAASGAGREIADGPEGRAAGPLMA